jgi:hypothetical protein
VQAASARSSSSSRAAARHPVHLAPTPAAVTRVCCARSCASTSPATFPRTRSAMRYEPHPPPTRKSTA